MASFQPADFPINSQRSVGVIFVPRHRVGRNPATGETIQLKAKRVVKFRVAKAAKNAILGAKKWPSAPAR